MAARRMFYWIAGSSAGVKAVNKNQGPFAILASMADDFLVLVRLIPGPGGFFTGKFHYDSDTGGLPLNNFTVVISNYDLSAMGRYSGNNGRRVRVIPSGIVVW